MTRTRKWVTVVAALALALTTVAFGPVGPAAAAGPAVLDLEITPVNYSNPTVVQTTLSSAQNRVAYRVNYSCAVATCTDATVTITPPQQNPYGITITGAPFLNAAIGPGITNYETWTAPPAGGTIGGDDLTGKVISLGDVPAGTSSEFTVVFRLYPTINRVGVPAQTFPSGFQVIHSATISSENAVADVTATAAPVTWTNTVPAGPTIAATTPGSTRPNVNVSFSLRMNSGSFGLSTGNIFGNAALVAAGNYVATFELPDEAEFVSATHGGTYDAGTHTITWAEGTEADPSFCAAGGWGSTANPASTWNISNPCYSPRTVVVSYPDTNFPEATDGCNFERTVTGVFSTSVTYLDAARTTKSVTGNVTHPVSCYDPFGRINVSKDSTSDAGTTIRQVWIPPTVDGLICDSSGYDAWGRACTPGQPLAPVGNNAKYWQVSAHNAGNVPGQAVVTDTALDRPDMMVHTISTTITTPTPVTEYTYQCGTSTPVTGSISSTSFTVASVGGTGPDCRFTAAEITSGVLAPGNTRPTDTAVGTLFRVNFHYTVFPGATPAQHVNTFTAEMIYPDYPEITGTFEGTASRTVALVPRPTTTVRPLLTSSMGVPVVAGGGLAVPGSTVTFEVGGTTSRFGGTSDFAPQYILFAPIGWDIIDGSATFGSATIPPGVTFSYDTVMVGGSPREVVVAQWPAGTTWGTNVTLPNMTVVATPTFAVAAGTTSVADAWLGDSRNEWNASNADFTAGVVDTVDADSDGSTDEGFSRSTRSLTVSGASGITVLKEICLPDAGEPDGCQWLGDPGQAVPVGTTAANITYRITIQNSGNTNLTGLVAYDVLPYVGDFGTSDGTASTPRGSTFAETLESIEETTPGLDLEFSTSTNPPRPEVYSGSTSGTWGSTVSGAQSIKATYGATLTPGASVGFTYIAAVGAGATADSRACNSVAIDTTETVPSEPAAVCAITAEADLEITVPDRLPLQDGRPGVLPFIVTNNGGSVDAPAIVTVAIPAGITVTSLTPEGWDCTAGGETVPVAGPVDLECEPVDGAGGVTTITLGTPVPLTVPVTPTAVSAELCVTAVVDGVMVDPVPANNETEACVEVAAFDGGVSITKDDERTEVAIGDEYTYEIAISSGLVGESLTDVVVTDELPAGVVFVSASDGGVLTGAGPDGSGGIVTWPATTLPATGVPGADGDATTGAPGTTVTRTVTVRVIATATGEVENLASVTAPDPADAASTLEDSATDVDDLRRLTVSKTSDALPAGVRSGETITYTVTIANSGTVAYDGATPAVIVDDLSGLLDDAQFVAGSAEITIGASTSPVARPVGGLLSWSGSLGVGQTAVLTYDVLVGDGGAGDRVLDNSVFASGAVAECVDGVDPVGVSCAVTSTPFAPVIDKRVASVAHNDDGTWTIVYDIDVTNLNVVEAATYRLDDALAFGSGISVDSAAVTTAPPGVTPEAWSGSGAIVLAAVVPAAGVHSYQLTVVADAGTVGGTAAALCQAGLAGGFANGATLTVVGSDPLSDSACASPVEPTVAKTVADAVQLPDGTWSVVYTVTVTNPHTGIPGGLAYTLDDTITVPSGVTVLDIAVSAPVGATVNPAFDGSTDTALLAAVDRVPAAASASVPATRVYTVTLHTDVPAGTGTAASFACPPAGTGGYANSVSLLSGGSDTELAEADACTRVASLPTPTITKSVTQTSIDSGTGYWTLVYDVAVTNPSAQFSTIYSLDDELQFAADATIVDATVGSAQATASAAWNGVSDIEVVAGQSLAAGATHHFTVTVTVDPAAVDVESAAADCLIDSGETGTGFRNLATVFAGIESNFAVACEPATDPSIVKTTVGSPVQDPTTGIWSLEYEVSVTNRSTTTVDGGIPYGVSDSLDFPAGIEIVDATATTEGGVLNEDWDGVDDALLGTGSIEAAADESTPARHTFTVTVQFRVPGGFDGAAECSPLDESGGLLNVVQITVGSRTSGAAACAEVPDVPVPGITKSVLSQEQQPDGTWLVLYRIEVGNPSDTAAVGYDLEDEFQLGEGMTLASTPTVVALPAGVTANPDWDGDATTVLAEDILLPGGGTHTYTVRAVVDSGAVRSTDAAADCTVDGDETSSGLANSATVGTGVASNDADACAEIFDPAVTKSVDGAPVRQPDGSFLVSYTMSVTNPSAIALSYGLEDELGFPAGTTVTVESAASRAGGPVVEADWDGQTQLQLIAEGTPLPADTVHVIDVTVRAVLAAGQASVEAGFANTATVESGVDGVIRSDADAAADLLVPVLEITKTATSDPVARIGSTVSFDVVIENTGEGAFTALSPAVVWDSLAGVLDDATFDGLVTATPSVGTSSYADGLVSWSGALAPGASVTLTYEVVVTGEGDLDIENIAFEGSPVVADPVVPTIGECDLSEACASTETALPAVSVEKTANLETATFGGTVTYTVRVTNTGTVDLPADDPAAFEDDLSGVLDDAVLEGDVTASIGEAEVVGAVLSWSGPLLAGESATVTYTVRVGSPPPGDRELINVVTTDATLPTLGADGAEGAGTATTSTPIRALASTGLELPIGVGILAALLVAAGALLVGIRRRAA